MPPHAKHEYKAQYETEFKKIRKGKDDYHAFCIPCKDEINLTSMGKAAIRVHQEKQKHKENAKAADTTRAISNFMPSRSAPTAIDDKTSAAEGAWAFHVATHNQAFSSTDCCSSDALFRTMFSDSQVAKKFGCGQAKTKAILTGVLAPYSVKCLPKELGAQPLSISTDASNHKEIKLFPLVIRFFTADKGVQVGLLDMKDLPGEDSQLVADFIAQILDKHGLKWQNLVSFCADNAPVNLGGPRMQGPINVFKKLLLKKKNLIPVGCPAHVFHNAAQKGADRLPLDIETVVFKLASYFKGSTSRHEQLKDVCKFLETNYETIPTHGPTRWLTLGKVINKILKLWEPLTALFGFANKPPIYLEKFFALEESLSVLQFLQSVLGVFEKPLLQLQKSTALLPELVEIVDSFKQKVVERKAKEFFGAATATSLERLDMKVKERLSASFQDFYTTVTDYVDKWFRIELLPTNISWIMLKENNIDYTEAVAPEIAVNDELFNEVMEVNRMLRQIPEDVFKVYPAETKWQNIFKDNDSLPNLYRLVSIIFSIQLANALVDRVFSLCKAQWTDTRNSLQVETVKALLQVRVNFDMDCADVYNLLMKDETLRKKIQGGEKWE